jgi:LDH2 family malate/lactate/ureidoglycolate dehydrogenase
MGAVGASKAMELAIKKARQSGMSFVTVRTSNHYSAASYFAQMALPHGMIGFTASNGPPRMAPWGGTDPHFGTDPFAVAIPAGRQLPIIADMATCVVARGKIIMAAKKGEPIPLGWARNADGEDTADANEALAGTVLPFAGPKGYAIATVIEVLTGILSGSRFTRGINDMYANFENPSFTSHYFGALNVEAFSSLAEFAESMDRFIVGVKANTLAKGAREIYLPGEIELRLKEARLKNGIPVSPIVFSELREEAETAGVAWNLD